MTLHDTRLPAGHQQGYDDDGAPQVASPVTMRFEFASHERNEGWLRLADSDGVAHESHRLSEFIAAIPCFTPCVSLATEAGPRLAGALRVGDRVLTRDNGPQEVRWIGRRQLGWRDLGLNPTLRPVRIAAGALGDGVPAADMLVSPNHRFLAALPGQSLTDATERLWQARALIGRQGIARVDAQTADYVQVLLDRHELVLSDGCWSESFQPSGPRIAALAPAQRAELMDKLPELSLADDAVFAPVRPEATGAETI